MPDKRVLFVAQLLITIMMAFAMSGIMSLIALGPTEKWVSQWPAAFLTAWPIAFVLTFATSKIAFSAAPKIVREFKRRRSA